MKRTSNPVLPSHIFSRHAETLSNMTLSGVMIKTGLLLILVIMGAIWTWQIFINSGEVTLLSPLLFLSSVAGILFALLSLVKQTWSPITAPLYALCQGIFIGSISVILEQAFSGILIQATFLTFGTLIATLLVYRSGLIQVTHRFKLVISSITGGIFITYLIVSILNFFNMQLPFFMGNGILSILFNLFVISIAALNIILDFDFIEKGVKRGSPKFMEWYAAFALMVTLVWIYVEFIRLISKLRYR